MADLEAINDLEPLVVACFAEIAVGSRPCSGRDHILVKVRMVRGSSLSEDFGDRYFLETERAWDELQRAPD
jgi:hypothetical protein